MRQSFVALLHGALSSHETERQLGIDRATIYRPLARQVA